MLKKERLSDDPPIWSITVQAKVFADTDLPGDETHWIVKGEGIKKFTDPQKRLLAMIAKKRKLLAGTR